MFKKLQRRLHRAISFDTTDQPSPTTAASTREQTRGEVASRKLRRTAATRNLKGTSAANGKEAKVKQEAQMSPQTPERAVSISREEHDSGAVLKGTLSGDGGSVRLLSGVVMDVSNAVTSSPCEEESPFIRNSRKPLIAKERNASSATVIIHRRAFECRDAVDTDDDEPMFEFGKSAFRTQTSTRVDLKRIRTRLIGHGEEDSEEDENKSIRPQKRARKLSDISPSQRSASPSPTHERYNKRSKSTPIRTQSEPETLRICRESIENDPSQIQGHEAVRRIWSAGDVLGALSTSRATNDTDDTATPPASPEMSPLTTQHLEHRLLLPEIAPPKLERAPLTNITNDYVPDFLQPPEPEIQVVEEPPTPGCIFRCLSDNFTDGSNDSAETLLGLDGAADSKIADEGDQQSVNSMTSDLSDDLEDAGEDGKPKQPIISHVLRGLDNDARFLQDVLRQVKALREKVAKHDRKTRRAKARLDENTVCDITSYIMSSQLTQTSRTRMKTHAIKRRR